MWEEADVCLSMDIICVTCKLKFCKKSHDQDKVFHAGEMRFLRFHLLSQLSNITWIHISIYCIAATELVCPVVKHSSVDLFNFLIIWSSKGPVLPVLLCGSSAPAQALLDLTVKSLRSRSTNWGHSSSSRMEEKIFNVPSFDLFGATRFLSVLPPPTPRYCLAWLWWLF